VTSHDLKGADILPFEHKCIEMMNTQGTLVPKKAGSFQAEAIGFFEQKNPQHAFVWKGSKAI
jgi:hypothetical protein